MNDADDLDGDPLPFLLPIPSPLASLPHNYHSSAVRCLSSCSTSSTSSCSTSFCCTTHAATTTKAAAATETKEGRGLFATRDVKEGELLMVANPMVAADASTCFRLFKGKKEKEEEEEEEGVGAPSPLHTIVEAELVRGLRALLTGKKTRKATKRLLTQMADGHKTNLPPPTDLGEVDKRGEELETEEEEEEDGEMDDASLLAVVRMNAYGPEFKQYPQIEADWSSLPSSSSSSSSLIYTRLCGLYPLPALINHACVANACRVYVGDTMLVRATKTIKQGEEVVWPYVSPLQSYAARQAALRQAFDFSCRCPRCLLEGGGEGENEDSSAYLQLQTKVLRDLEEEEGEEEVGQHRSIEELEALIEEVEKAIKDKCPTDAEARRWCRASFLSLYFSFFNHPSLFAPGHEASQQKAATYQNDLCWSLLSVNNVSTEHLSLLHTCYESAQHYNGMNSPLARLWVNQLSKAHVCRYGQVQDVGGMTTLLKHTRLVLRTKDGYKQSTYAFL